MRLKIVKFNGWLLVSESPSNITSRSTFAAPIQNYFDHQNFFISHLDVG